MANLKLSAPLLADADKIQFVEMVDRNTKAFAEKTKEIQENFLN
jgi:hypothetical protein